MAKTEDIEAKLAAFVDGEIDEAGRAEIEKHLETNPKHRQLLADLSSQRDLIRALPRDLAPADVAETINSQLERAVLLGDVDGETEIAGTIGFWSQFRAVAAILLLTVGLAAMIYYLLPSPGSRAREMADLRIQAPPATAPMEQNSPPTELPAAPAAASSSAAARMQIAMRDEAPAGIAMGQGDQQRSMASNVLSPQQEVFNEVVQSRPNSESQKATDDSTTYVVSTEDPAATGRELRDYLTSNNITWESGASEPMPAPLDASQEQMAMGSRLQQQPMVQLKSQAIAPATMPSQLLLQDQVALQPDRVIAKQLTRGQLTALRIWLDARRNDAVNGTAIAPKGLTLNSEIPTANDHVAQALPTTAPGGESPATQPYAVELGLSEILDFAPPRLDAPTIEFKPREAEAVPTTQPQELSLAVQMPTTAPSVSERMDVVIVLESHPATTQPAATEPSP